ncbi:MAG: phosphate ABC transporter permease [Chloroflexi bacterium HGW-Chloroflexi-1]|nr:MAG: phosphate ABC transporter permease [Chloroflexi bacterium HGW-Chloroflexi-1]
MSAEATVAQQPSDMGPAETQPSTVVIQPTRGWASLKLRDVWRYRELLFFLVWRDVKVRYKQTALGVTWIILQPLLSMVVFSVLFGTLLQVPSGGVPYPIFSFAALLPWNYFAGSLGRSSTSLVNSAHLITKVYFPRLIIPLSGVLAGLVDFAVAFLVLIGLMLYYGVALTPAAAFVPAFLLLAILTASGFGLWLSALNVRFRDVNYLIPFLLQVWMYLTPVIYGSTLVPERFRFLLGLNPMTSVVEGFRWALLGHQLTDAQPAGPLFALSIGIALLVLVSGVVFFRRTERIFADII